MWLIIVTIEGFLDISRVLFIKLLVIIINVIV